MRGQKMDGTGYRFECQFIGDKLERERSVSGGGSQMVHGIPFANELTL